MRYRHDVASFERPETSIPWKDKDGKIRQYTPDLIVRYKPDEDHPKGRTIVCEVKPNFEEDEGKPARLLPRDEDEEENKLKWAAAAIWAEARGWSFKVFRSTEPPRVLRRLNSLRGLSHEQVEKVLTRSP